MQHHPSSCAIIACASSPSPVLYSTRIVFWAARGRHTFCHERHMPWQAQVLCHSVLFAIAQLAIGVCNPHHIKSATLNEYKFPQTDDLVNGLIQIQLENYRVLYIVSRPSYPNNNLLLQPIFDGNLHQGYIFRVSFGPKIPLRSLRPEKSPKQRKKVSRNGNSRKMQLFFLQCYHSCMHFVRPNAAVLVTPVVVPTR